MAQVIRRVLVGFDTVTGYLDEAVKALLAIAMFTMFVLLLLNVLSRYVILTPFFWLAEGAGYLMALVGLWGSSTCVRNWKHMQVNIILKRLSGESGEGHPVARNVLVIVMYSALILYAYVMVHYGYNFAEFGRFEQSPSGYFIVFWPRLTLPTGGLLILVQSLNMIGRAVVNLMDMRKTGSGEMVEEGEK